MNEHNAHEARRTVQRRLFNAEVECYVSKLAEDRREMCPSKDRYDEIVNFLQQQGEEDGDAGRDEEKRRCSTLTALQYKWRRTYTIVKTNDVANLVRISDYMDALVEDDEGGRRVALDRLKYVHHRGMVFDVLNEAYTRLQGSGARKIYLYVANKSCNIPRKFCELFVKFCSENLL